MVNSIKKGKRFEREMCKYLTKKLGVKFYRVANSGGLQTSSNLQNNIFKGDIFTEEAPWNNVVFECKFRKKLLKLDELFTVAEKGNLNGFLAQVWTSAGCGNVLGNSENWCLFVKSNHSKPFVITNNEDLLLKLTDDYLVVKGKLYSFVVGVLK